MSGDLHSIRREPQHAAPPSLPSSPPGTLPFPDPASHADHLLHAAASEPHLGDGARTERLRWLESQRSGCAPGGSLLVQAGAAVLGGLFAVLGAFLAHLIIPVDSLFGLANLVLVGPVTEELLKASGALYLLEKRPWHLRPPQGGIGILLVVLTSATLFAGLENLLYIHLYTDIGALADPAGYVRFRWIVPTAVHLVCSGIAALGLAAMWRRQILRGESADLHLAYPFFATAIFLHGAYNLAAWLGDGHLFPKT